MLGGSGGGGGGGVDPPPPPRDISSPTFTENSLNYSQSEEVIEALRAKVEQLEMKLDKESENNSELRVKLSAAEQKLHSAENKKRQKQQQQQ